MCARPAPKGAYLVTVETGEVADLTVLEMDVVRWSVLGVDVTPAGGIGDVVDLMREAVVQDVEEADGRLLACRILLQGRTELHSRLVTGTEEIDGRGAICGARFGRGSRLGGAGRSSNDAGGRHRHAGCAGGYPWGSSAHAARCRFRQRTAHAAARGHRAAGPAPAS